MRILGLIICRNVQHEIHSFIVRALSSPKGLLQQDNAFMASSHQCISINNCYNKERRAPNNICSMDPFRFSTNLNNSRAMSMSAPSAINTDFTTVKFDDETTEWNDTGTSQVKSAMSHRFVNVIKTYFKLLGYCINYVLLSQYAK